MATGESAKAKAPAASRATSRSCQRPLLRTNWRVGRASKNSLARRSRGADVGTVWRVACQLGVVLVEQLGLTGAQDGAGLDQVQLHGLEELGHDGGGAERVGHQRAAAGPELDQPDRGGAAGVEPGLDQGEAQELAEELADLGGGDEVAGGPQGVAARVVAVLRVGQGERHVAADIDGALLPDHAAEEGGQLAQRVAIRAGRKDQASSRRPASSIGRLSSWPIVMPPAR